MANPPHRSPGRPEAIVATPVEVTKARPEVRVVSDEAAPKGRPWSFANFGRSGRAEELRLEEWEEEEEEWEEWEEEKEEEEKEVPKTPEAEEENAEEVTESPALSPSSEERMERRWELFGHLVEEDLRTPGRISIIRCVRCGLEAPLPSLRTFKEKPCVPTTSEKVDTSEKMAERGAEVSLPQRRCENCGRAASASLCSECADAYERYSINARPVPFRERWRGVQPPKLPGVDGWAWVNAITTFFPYRLTREGGREWWCPVQGCQMKFRRLIEVVDHFRDAHVKLVSRGWFEDYDPVRRVRVLRTWQGWVDETTMTLVFGSVMQNEGGRPSS